MAKLTLTDILTAFQSTAAINANNELIETAFENTLSRDGTTPNHMTADLDMNGNSILNAVYGIPLSDGVAGASTTVASKAVAVLLTPTSGSTIYILSDDGKGNIWQAVVGAAPGTYADDGGAYAGTIIIPTGGDGSTAWVRDYEGGVFATWFGASPSATGTINTSAIQTALASIASGTVYIPAGTYILASAGTHGPEVRNYGIILKSNVRLQGESMASVILKADTNEDMDIIISSRTSSSTNISLIDLTIDGNQANQSANTFNHWLYDIDGLVIHRVLSKDSCNWGFRLERCTNVLGNIIRAYHAADVNADGFHMQDCSACTLSDVLINTAGDDGFIITAQDMDVHDITVSGLVVTCPVTVAAAGRGILLNLGTIAEAASQQRNFKNITINATTYNCKGAAAVLTYGEFENINLTLNDYGSLDGLYLVCGSSNVTGYIKGCKFDINSNTPDQTCMTTVITDGVVENNHLDLTGYNPGDGFVGVDLEGDYWNGTISIDYDPAGTKVSGLQPLDMWATYSNLNVSIGGGGTGTNGINLRAAATNNTFHMGSISGTATNSINVLATANYNTFVGGVIDDTVSDSGTGTKFIGVTGAAAYGSASMTPDANGNDTIAHGLVQTPVFADVAIRGDNTVEAVVQSIDGTNITVRIKDAAGADVAAGTYNVFWEASL